MAEPAEIYQFPDRPREAVEDKRGPQVEEGYTRIAHPILDALCCADFNPREFRVALFVIRTTYGWNTKACRMTGAFIAKKVKLDPSRCSKVLNELIRRGVLIRHGGSRSPVSLNKHVDEWQPRVGSNRQPPTRCADSAQDEPTHSAQDEPTNKDRKDKLLPNGSNESSKKPKSRKWGEEIDLTLTDEMVQAVSADLEAPVKHNPTTWAHEFRLMRQRDGRTVEQIRYLIDWSAKHHFWSGVILSPAKLRAKWDQLAKQVKAGKAARPGHGMNPAERLHEANQQAIRQAVENRRNGTSQWGVGNTFDHDGGHW